MKKYFTLMAAILIASNVFAQETLTLDKAISIALQKNSSLIKSKNNLEINDADVKSAWGDLLPSLGASAGWDWQRIKDEGGLQKDFYGRDTLIPPSKNENRNYSVRLGGSITLFNGLSNYARINQAENDRKAARYSFDKVKQDIVLSVTERYYAVLNEKALLKVREDNVEYNNKNLETIQEKNKLGSVPIADVYAQQVQLGNAELLLIRQQNTYDRAKNLLLDFLALDVLEEYKLEDPDIEIENPFELDDQMKGINSLVSEALSYRNDYRSQQKLVDSRENSLTSAWGGVMPQLTGNYGFSSSALSLSELFNRKVFSAGLTLQIPIFSNFDVETRIQVAQINLRNAEEDLRALERLIKIEVKQGYLDLVASKKAYEVSMKNVTSAEENRRINNERYSLGAGTILDVLQSDRDFQQALRDNIDAEFSYYTQKDRLLNVIGKLDYKKFE